MSLPQNELPAPLPLELFDYALPQEAIAQSPAEPRDSSRLMVLRGQEPPKHQRFFDLPDFLAPGDVLLVNHTRVIPARLQAHKATGGHVELLLHTPLDEGAEGRASARRWKALARPAKGLSAGKELTLASGEVLTVLGRDNDSVIIEGTKPLLQVMEAEGSLPLPPYLDGAANPSPQDAASYQTMFGTVPGAVAAPTASLHFTPDVVRALEAKGVQLGSVLLHVGPGTFLPVRPEHAFDVRGHTMHGEWYEIPEATQALVRAARARGSRVVAVGTTSLRAVETWSQSGSAKGVSTLFVTPGYSFECVTGLLTNFHLPRSTLLMLVSAMAGRERMLAAYAEALRSGYRFFSFGDAMLLLGGP